MIYLKDLNLESWLHKQPGQSTGIEGSRLLIAGKNSCEIYVYEKDGSLCTAIHNYKYEKFQYPEPEGFQIRLANLKIDESGTNEYIVMECSKPVFFKTFLWFTKEVSENVLSARLSPRTGVLDAIDLVKGFINEASIGQMSKEEQYGLMCELIVLEQFMKSGFLHSLESWQHSDNFTQDFIFEKWLIEVKGTLRGKHQHTINGLNQLQCPALFCMAVISFTLVEGSGESLQNIIDRIDADFLVIRPGQRKMFYSKLLDRKYHISDKDAYYEYSFQTLSSRIYKIVDETPKIVPTSFVQGLSAAISRIRYDLDFENLPFSGLDKTDLSEYC